MTPEEKAKELVEKYKEPTQQWNGDEWEEDIDLATQCAEIVVDEILKLEVWGYPHNTPEGVLYWEEVRKELLKL